MSPTTYQHDLIDSRPLLDDSESALPASRRYDGSRLLQPEEITISNGRAVAIMGSMWALIFIQSSNMSGIAMLQSSISADLDADRYVLWFAASYLIALSAFTPVIGGLANLFPSRLLILPVSILVAFGSMITAVAPNLIVFLLGRIITGIGSAGVFSLAMILILDLVGEKKRGGLLAVANTGFTIGLSFGAVVYGAAVRTVGWRAIFAIQAPVALAGGIGVMMGVPVGSKRIRNRDVEDLGIWDKLRTIDYGGVGLLAASISLFLFGLAGTVRPGFIVSSIAILSSFVFWEYNVARTPIIPISVLGSRGVLYTCVAQLIFVSARWTLLYFGPIFMLAVKGWKPVSAGAILIPTNVGYGGGGLAIGWLHIRRGGSFWLPSILALVLFSLSLVIVSSVGYPTTSDLLFIFYVFVNGVATGGAMNYTLAHVLHLTTPEDHNIATSLLGTFRGFGGSFGTAIGGGFFLRSLQHALQAGFAKSDGGELSQEHARLVGRLVGRPDQVWNSNLSLKDRDIAVDSYAGAMRTTWVMAAIVGVVAIVLQIACGDETPDKKGPERENEDTSVRAALLASEGVHED